MLPICNCCFYAVLKDFANVDSVGLDPPSIRLTQLLSREILDLIAFFLFIPHTILFLEKNNKMKSYITLEGH